MNEVTRRWIEAGKLLAKDPTATVICPACTSCQLDVHDLNSRVDPDVVERILQCPSCGAVNSLRLVKPGIRLPAEQTSAAADFAASAVKFVVDPHGQEGE